jgi:hypothetical protein
MVDYLREFLQRSCFKHVANNITPANLLECFKNSSLLSVFSVFSVVEILS